jgi:hypothetical protein
MGRGNFAPKQRNACEQKLDDPRVSGPERVSRTARQKRAPRTPSLQGFRGSCLFAVICGREQAREDAQGPRVEQLLTISPDLGYDLHEVFDDSGVLAATLSSPIAVRLLLQGTIDGVRAA